jgi:isopentenyl-diphosphate delta-isomerase
MKPQPVAECVILVDPNDIQVGTRGKLQAHRHGELHRAFSVFLFSANGEMLIQKRAPAKYHTPGLWTNTCDGHPRPDETVVAGAQRRLEEEMGIRCPLAEAFTFVYRAELGAGLVENEYDHVLIGRFDGEPGPNAQEYSAWRWIDRETLTEQVRAHPDSYAPWFTIALNRVWAYAPNQ